MFASRPHRRSCLGAKEATYKIRLDLYQTTSGATYRTGTQILIIATFRLTSIRWFSKGQKCNLDLTAGASHARSAPSCGRGCGADLRGGHAGSLLPGRVCLSRCAVAAGRPSLGLARGCGAVRRGLGGCVGVSVRASLSRGCEEAPLGGAAGNYLTELTVEFRKAVRQSHPQPSCQPGAELGADP